MADRGTKRDPKISNMVQPYYRANSITQEDCVCTVSRKKKLRHDKIKLVKQKG